MKNTLKCVMFLITVSVSPMLSQEIDLDKRLAFSIPEYEAELGGTLNTTIPNYRILKNPQQEISEIIETKAVIYKRESDDFFPNLHVWYHFDTAEDRLLGIRYNWGFYNPTFDSNIDIIKYQALTTQEKRFKKHFKKLECEISKKLGSPTRIKDIANDPFKIIRYNYWEDSEKVIALCIWFHRQTLDLAETGIMGDYKIEVLVTYKNGEKM